MIENKEIKALLQLLDDPDEYVYSLVGERIVALGREIIPELEHAWETIPNEAVQERIEMLIHRVHYRELSDELKAWQHDPHQDLLKAALLVAKYQYPEIQTEASLQWVEKIRRNIWLELNQYLTPLEQIHVFNSIFYNYFKMTGVEIDFDHPDQFLLHKTLETKQGNAHALGILYLVLCQLLDIPVFAVSIPKQFLLAYMHQDPFVPIAKGHGSEKISFYIDPLSGQVYSHKDIENYFKRLSVPPISHYFKPKKPIDIIRQLLESFSSCFDNDRNRYKMLELLDLAEMLSNED